MIKSLVVMEEVATEQHSAVNHLMGISKSLRNNNSDGKKTKGKEQNKTILSEAVMRALLHLTRHHINRWGSVAKPTKALGSTYRRCSAGRLGPEGHLTVQRSASRVVAEGHGEDTDVTDKVKDRWRGWTDSGLSKTFFWFNKEGGGVVEVGVGIREREKKETCSRMKAGASVLTEDGHRGRDSTEEGWNGAVKWRKAGSRAGESETAACGECGSGWSGKKKKERKNGSFGPYKVTLLQAHNAGELQPP